MSSTNESSNDESFASLFASHSAAHPRRKKLNTGDEVEGVVVKVGHENVFFALDGKRESFVPKHMLTDGEGEAISISVGDVVRARAAENPERAGSIILEPVSIRRKGDEGDQVVLVGSQGPALVEGARMNGEVVRVERYGIFVQLEGTEGRKGQGLVHASETGLKRGVDFNKEFPLGSTIEVMIIGIDETGKIRLSIKALKADAEKEAFQKFASKPKEKKGASRGKSGFGTFADLFAQNKKK